MMPATLLSSRRDDARTTLSFRKNQAFVVFVRALAVRMGWKWDAFGDFDMRKYEDVVLKIAKASDTIQRHEQDGESVDIFVGHKTAFLIYCAPQDRHQLLIDEVLKEARWTKPARKKVVRKKAVKRKR